MRGLLVLWMACLAACPASAQEKPPRAAASASERQLDRRFRARPELVLETGGRTGVCDVLTFTPDGKHLLAAGEDKVVRVWQAKAGRLVPAARPVLRWSRWREQRGAIYAMAIDRADPDGKRVAVAGMGLLDRPHVVVIDRLTGEVEKHLPDAPPEYRFPFSTVRALAYSGRHIALGTTDGRLWLWDLGRASEFPRLIYPPDQKLTGAANPWRLLHFEDDHRLLGVSGTNGAVLRWDLREPKPAAQNLGAFGFGVYYAAISPDGKKLAASASRGSRIQVRAVQDKEARDVPGLRRGENRCCFAFSPDGKELVVGAGMIPFENKLEGDDRIAFYDVSGHEIKEKPGGLPHTYHVDTLTFDPSGKYLAVAGGENHEVKLYARKNLSAGPSVAVGVGVGVWDVALSKDGHFLGFKDKRKRGRQPLNQRGDGDWRVFDLRERKFAGHESFTPHPRVESADGWKVKPDAKDFNVWHVTNAALNVTHPLELDPRVFGTPRCYAFAPAGDGQPTRLLLGHHQGHITVHELTEKGARLARVFVSGQGEVTALAVAPNGQWLVSASVDQTIAAWSLAPFPRQRELGARFVQKGDKVILAPDGIDRFSPAWEAGFEPGDEVVFLAVGRRGGRHDVVHNPRGRYNRGASADPARCLAELRNPTPARELFVEVLRRGEPLPLQKKTTVRQRPLWRFFASRDGEWLMWAWHAPYYDCSENADRLLGPVMNDPRPLAHAPRRYPLQQFKELYERYDVIARLLETNDVDKALRPEDEPLPFERIEPASLKFERVSLVSARGDKVAVAPRGERQSRGVTDENIELTVVAEPRDKAPEQLPRRAELWLNDYRAYEWEIKGDEHHLFRRDVRVPNQLLRAGKNRLTFQCFARVGNRETCAAREFEVVFERQSRPGVWGRPAPNALAARPTFRALLVGVGNYANSAKYTARPLPGAVNDATALDQLLRETKDTIYGSIQPTLLPDERSPRAILGHLEKLTRKGAVGPDDLLLVFLAGHGEALPQGKAGKSQFVFCCADYDPKRPAETGLAADQLFKVLVRIPCRKLILLDACRSGSLTSGPTGDLLPAGKGPAILAACDHKQRSFEHEAFGEPGRGGHGAFTKAVLEALGREFDKADASPKDGRLDEQELHRYVLGRMPALLKQIGQGERSQVPLRISGDAEPHLLLGRQARAP